MDLIDGLKTKAVDVYSLASRTKKVFSLQFHGGKREDPEWWIPIPQSPNKYTYH